MGGMTAHLGFGLLAVAWLTTGFMAYRSVRRGRYQDHRRWMVRNFALTLAAVTLRIYIPSAMASSLAFGVAYPIIAWACWVPNLLVAEWLVRRRPERAVLIQA